MKRALCGVAAALAIGGAMIPAIAAASNGNGNGQQKITFCHATSSASNPYVKITTASPSVVFAHLKHHDGKDKIPAFTYKGKSYGDASADAFIANGCAAPVTPPPVDPGSGGGEL